MYKLQLLYSIESSHCWEPYRIYCHFILTLVFSKNTRKRDRQKCLGQTQRFNVWTIDRTSGQPMDQITIKTPNPEGLLLLKIYLHRDLAAGVYLSDAASPPRFLFGVVQKSNFVGSDSGHIKWSYMLSTQPDPIPPPPTCYTLYNYIPLYLFTQGRGRGELTSKKVRGALVHKAESIIPTWLTVSPVYKLY